MSKSTGARLGHYHDAQASCHAKSHIGSLPLSVSLSEARSWNLDSLRDMIASDLESEGRGEGCLLPPWAIASQRRLRWRLPRRVRIIHMPKVVSRAMILDHFGFMLCFVRSCPDA